MRLMTAIGYGPSYVREWLEMKIAWLLPRRIAMWAMVRVAAHATTGKYGSDHIDQLGYKEFHDRWMEQPNG